MTKPLLILASSSPQRLKLLKLIGVTPDKILPAEINETPLKNEKPKDFVLRMSKEKALEISKNHKNDFVLSGDTIVVAGRRIIGKPLDRKNAGEILNFLSGRRHLVLSAITLIRPGNFQTSKLITTRVKFANITKNALEEFIIWEKTNAGGYAIQGGASSFIPWINGSYTGTMGFPINEVNNLLLSSGWKKIND